MKIGAMFKEPIHGTLDEATHDSISLDATVMLDSANHGGEQGQYRRYADTVINAQLNFVQSYLAYRLGFSDTADGVVPSKEDVEAEAGRLLKASPTIDAASKLIKAAIEIVDRKIDEEAKLVAPQLTTQTQVGS